MSEGRLPVPRPDEVPVFDARAPSPLIGRGVARLQQLAAAAGLAPPAIEEDDPVLLWTFDLQSSLYFAYPKIVATEDSAYIATHMHRRGSALDAATGAQRWSIEARSTQSAIWALGGVGDRVVTYAHSEPSESDACAHLFGVDATNGSVIWRTRPAVRRYRHYLDGRAGMAYAHESGGLCQYDARTGEARWCFEYDGTPLCNISVSPGVAYLLVARESVDERLFAIDTLTGAERWRFRASGAGVGVWGAGAVVVADGLLFVVDSESDLHALDAADGHERWHVHGVEYQHALEGHAPLVADGTVYVETTTSISAFDCVTGEERWRVPRLDTFDNLFAVARGAVYVANCLNRMCLYALDAATGVERWRVALDRHTYWRPTLADTTVYVRTFPFLHALDADNGTERWRFGFDEHAYQDSDVSVEVAGDVVYAVVAAPVGQRAVYALRHKRAYSRP